MGANAELSSFGDWEVATGDASLPVESETASVASSGWSDRGRAWPDVDDEREFLESSKLSTLNGSVK